MIFALGCLTAGLVMLLALPAVWRRAVRLSTRRLAMQVPLSVDEIVAERDQLRAAFAVEQRKLEQKNEAMLLVRAEDMAELGRRAVRLMDQAQTVKAQSQDLLELGGQLAATQKELQLTQAETGTLHKALFDEEGLRGRREGQLRALEDAHQILQITAGQQQVSISDLETRLSVTQMDLADHAKYLQDSRRALAHRDEEVETLFGERGHARAQVISLMQRRDSLHVENLALGDKAAALEAALATARAEAAAVARDIGQRDETIARNEQQIQDLAARAKAAQARSERALEQAYASERDMAQRLETIRSEKAAANGALQVARDERSRLQRELVDAQAQNVSQSLQRSTATPEAAAQPDTDETLRRAISELADRLLQFDMPSVDVPAPLARPQRLRGQPKKPVEKQTVTADPASA